MNQVMRQKLAGLFVCVVLALALLLIRVTYISAVSGEDYAKQILSTSQSQYYSKTLAYKRGEILDRNHTVLATSEMQYDLILDCKTVNTVVEDKEKNKTTPYIEPTTKALTEVFGFSEKEIHALLTEDETKDLQYRIIKKNISIEDKKAFDDYVNGTEKKPLSDEEKEERRYITGIRFEEHYVRQYPLKTLASQVVGFVNGNQKWGIEGYYDNTLTGVNGRSFGYWETGADLSQNVIEPKNGNTIISTIDINVQSVVEKYLKKYDELYTNEAGRSAKNIGIVVMNPNDGSILAMADSESFDPNNPGDLSQYYSEEQIAAMTPEQQSAALKQIWQNYCITDTFEPGSVFKPITIAAALESGAFTGNEKFNCTGSMEVAGTTIRCAHVHGELTLAEVISESCNVGLMQAAQKLGAETFDSYQQLFGFGALTGIDLSGEEQGIIRTADTMSSVDLATSSFGQSFNVTMIQEAAAIASLVNGGFYYRPHVVSRIVDEQGRVVRSIDKILSKQTVSKEVSDMLKSYMKICVDNGTSVYSKVDGYSMGGKTGTAQKIPRGNGKYLVSWIGFTPYENPEVLIYVVIDEPNAEYQDDNRYPQWIARDILQEILPYLGIYQDEAENPSNPYLALDLDRPEGEVVPESAADANVPEPKGTDKSQVTPGNTAEEGGYTNKEAGLE